MGSVVLKKACNKRFEHCKLTKTNFNSFFIKCRIFGLSAEFWLQLNIQKSRNQDHFFEEGHVKGMLIKPYFFCTSLSFVYLIYVYFFFPLVTLAMYIVSGKEIGCFSKRFYSWNLTWGIFPLISNDILCLHGFI